LAGENELTEVCIKELFFLADEPLREEFSFELRFYSTSKVTSTTCDPILYFPLEILKTTDLISLIKLSLQLSKKIAIY
jgi:hypothetical protein